MIERLRITNFQCHERLDIQFDSGITTIVGPSDVGKSSALRALRWVCLNRPRGDGFIRDGEKTVQVKVKVDGRTVRRERGSANSYSMDDESYTAFGNEVPVKIEKLLGLSDVNFSGQHDPPYWFGLTSSELARQLNSIVDLEIIDRMTTHLSSRIRSLQGRLEIVGSRLAEALETRRRLTWVVSAGKELDRLVGKRETIQGLEKRITQLGGIVIELREVERLATVKVPMTKSLESLKTKMEEEDNRYRGLLKLVRDLKDQMRLKAQGYKDLEEARERLDKETGGRCPVCGGELR